MVVEHVGSKVMVKDSRKEFIMKNNDLINIYNNVYSNGCYNFWSEEERDDIEVLAEVVGSLEGKEVLEIGCGEGDLCEKLSNAGAVSVVGADFSEEAIKIATKKWGEKDGIKYICCNYKDIKGKFDVVTMAGVLEHFDKPFEELKYIKENLLKENGVIVTSSPNFINPRGYVWMTLALLFDVPMSLTDLHFLGPWQFEEFAKSMNMKLEMKSCSFDWGHGQHLIRDYKKRLPNALNDSGMSSKNVDKLLEWLEKSSRFDNPHMYSGAMMIYKLF